VIVGVKLLSTNSVTNSDSGRAGAELGFCAVKKIAGPKIVEGSGVIIAVEERLPDTGNDIGGRLKVVLVGTTPAAADVLVNPLVVRFVVCISSSCDVIMGRS